MKPALTILLADPRDFRAGVERAIQIVEEDGGPKEDVHFNLPRALIA